MFLSHLYAGYVTKQCLANGTWYLQNGKEWSNFGNCARDDVCSFAQPVSIVLRRASFILRSETPLTVLL